MKSRQLLCVLTVAAIMMGCSKKYEYPTHPAPPSPAPTRKILLKNVDIPRLPSPYYHFEYGADSLVNKAIFDDGLTNYDIFYSGGRISEMRNNIIVNHDTLRYIYDNTGKVTMVNFINQNNVLYRHAAFTYSGQQVSRVEWALKNGNGFTVDRSMDFAYHPDGNLKEMHEFRPAVPGGNVIDITYHYDQYDNKVNVDDYTLIHDGIHDHLLVLPNLGLQKNNPKKEWLTGNSDTQYTVDYTYTYNSDNAPVKKTGTLLFTRGDQNGQRFTTTTNYSYY